MKLSKCLSSLLVAITLLSVAAPAQDTNPAQPEAPAIQQSPANGEQQDRQREILKEEESQRILGLMPQFGVINQNQAFPLTSGEKFRLFYKQAFDPFVYASSGFQAGLSQAENEFPGYGQGAAGYGKRYGATFADQLSSGFFANFFYPTLLKEDPRYYRLGEGTLTHRLLYSVTEEVVAHKDKGGRTFAFDNVLGAFSSGSFSNLYYPGTDRGFSLTMSRSLIALGYGSVGGLVSEFWPDIHDRLFSGRRKKADELAPQSAVP